MKELAPLPVDVATLQLLGERVRSRLGLHFPDERLADLERGLRGAARDFGFLGAPASLECARWLISAELTDEQVDTLARHLTIGETYFFRDPALFEVLRLKILPALVAGKAARGEKSLRLWCAACCTGEEPYSLAMLLDQVLPALTPNWRDWQVTLLATDLNPQFLAKARAGIYGAWSFRDHARGEQRVYFKPSGEGRFEIRPELRDNVRFEQLNLVTARYPAAANGTAQQDLIFCRNVLIYFTRQQARTVAEKLTACLSEGGYLVPSASEASPQTFCDLSVEHHPGAIVYRKSVGPAPAPKRQMPSVPIRPAPAVRPVAPPRRFAPVDAKVEAQAAMENGEHAAALHWCNRALSAGKMDAELHLLRAALLDETNPDGAEAALHKSLYLEPDSVAALMHLARLALRRKQRAAAKKMLNTALRVLMTHDPAALVPGTRQTTAELADEVAGILEGFDEG